MEIETTACIQEEGKNCSGDKPAFFGCYLLRSLSPGFTGTSYIGSTSDPRRRLRQHNGEIKSGANRTKKKRPWEMILVVYGFPSKVSVLQASATMQIPKERSHCLLKEGVTILFAKDIQNIYEVKGTQIEAPSYNEPYDHNTITVEEEKRMEPQISEWNRNIAEASGEYPSNLATEGHWNTGPHREYAEQGDEDGWS